MLQAKNYLWKNLYQDSIQRNDILFGKANSNIFQRYQSGLEMGNGKFDRMLDGRFSGRFNVVRREDGALRYNESCDALENSQKCEDRCFNEAEECYLSCENQEK